jgi:membrane fusion protein (multidrug efflux system)
MRSLLIVALVIVGLILGKIFLFPKKDAGGGQGPGMAATSKTSGQAGQGVGQRGGGGNFAVDVRVADYVDVSDKIFASGTFVSNESVELRSEASGIIKTLNFNEGSLVSKGQLIAKIKDDDIRAQIKRLDFEEQLAAQIEARQKKLLDINAISKEEYDLAVNRINILSADKEALEVRLRQTEVRAPFSGKIGLKNISVGAYVTPALTIATLVQIQPIKMDFDIPEKYNNRLTIGKSVMVTTEDDNVPRSATITAISPLVDETLRSVRLRATMPNASGTLKPGMFGRVEIPLSTVKGIMMPTEALIPFAGGKKLFVVKEGKAKEVPVISGIRTEKDLEIVSGISKGDTVVISGLMNIKDGQNLTIKSVQ